jgi:hypothetical protein
MSHNGNGPYRGVYGEPRPSYLSELSLPPNPMPPRDGLRPLKQWRYVGVYAPELMLCAATVRVGPARQTFWAIWDRERKELRERTTLGRGSIVRLDPGSLRVRDTTVQIDLQLEETAGVESVNPSGGSYAWTCKQGGIEATGTVTIAGRTQVIAARAIIDDTAAYYERHTSWRWSAGVGRSTKGQVVAWNLVEGVNDPAANSERTVWVDGVPSEPPSQPFASDLSKVGKLHFNAEATREHNENRLLIRSRYVQPFGTFSGTLPGGLELEDGYGVMEDHDVWW